MEAEIGQAGMGGIARHRGPNPGWAAAACMALFLAGLAPVTLLYGETHFPAPGQPAEEIESFFRTEAARVGLCASLQFLASVPLAAFGAAMASRLRFHRGEDGWSALALAGGTAASAFMAMSAAAQWALARPGIAEDPALARALYFFLFAAGGPGYSVPLGLLIGGIAASAGTSGLLPRWLTATGLALGVVGLLSGLTFAIPGALFLIPLTRFPGFLWMIAAGFKLPGTRIDPSKPGLEGIPR